MKKTSQRGIDLIKRFEGCNLTAYLCPAGVPTIGYGHTGGVKIGETITQEHADRLLASDLVRFELAVDRHLPNATQSQFDALVSFSFNVGVGAFERSTLLRKAKGGDIEGAAREFARWNKAGGKVLAGLTRRCEAQRVLFLS
jgi:GH24 family phage-related lysozyme (muramidase)